MTSLHSASAVPDEHGKVKSSGVVATLLGTIIRDQSQVPPKGSHGDLMGAQWVTFYIADDVQFGHQLLMLMEDSKCDNVTKPVCLWTAPQPRIHARLINSSQTAWIKANRTWELEAYALIMAQKMIDIVPVLCFSGCIIEVKQIFQ